MVVQPLGPTAATIPVMRQSSSCKLGFLTATMTATDDEDIATDQHVYWLQYAGLMLLSVCAACGKARICTRNTYWRLGYVFIRLF